MDPNSITHQKRVIFAGIARDCEKFLPNVLEEISSLSEIFIDSAFIFLENDSQDLTKKILNDWGQSKNNFTLLNMDGLGQLPIRTLRLEYLRNTYIEFIKKNDVISNFDYLLTLDMDDVNTEGLNIDRFIESVQFLDAAADRAAVFANQEGIYYDMWALRHKELCPGDIWEEALDFVDKFKLSDVEAYQKTFRKRILSFDKNRDFVEVDSAFGGIGIYKLSYVLNNPNPYLGSKVKVLMSADKKVLISRMQVCEHVHFHRGIRAIGGKLFINPALINFKNKNENFNPSFFRSLLF
ncbi:hypothetical protein AOC06_00695 [Polynucleobacter paludilacus]|uniref:hypothetical protein n=1 Tax=Polynucleobacter paludilacus TaxID=1855895 RepID=UPI001BFEA818|nr:hypothetical protein [Polynucleobacter paludilacus]QWD87133.1 hypothetical protein AOC06_00695 [Polynucleobacter paludilacus]